MIFESCEMTFIMKQNITFFFYVEEVLPNYGEIFFIRRRKYMNRRHF